MADTPEHQQRADPRRPRRGGRRPSREQIRERLLAERRAAVVELARLSGAAEHEAHSGTHDSPFEEDDVAQAREQMDVSLMHRERVAQRINRLTRALERLAHDEYGVCEECGRDIQPARLAALPEVAVCLECQERRERGERAGDAEGKTMMTIVTRVMLKEGAEPEWDGVMRQRLAAAREQPGWVGGQLMIPLDGLNQRVIVGSWQTRADWEAWHNDAAFRETRRRLDGLETGHGEQWWHEVIADERPA